MIYTCYFNYQPDPQRGKAWGNGEDLKPLIDSCNKHGLELTVFHNGIDLPCNSVYVDPSKRNPIDYRWQVYAKHVKERGWFVDATDVIVQSPPRPTNALHCGDEWNQTVDSKWMKVHCEPFIKIPDYKSHIKENAHRILLNCGVVYSDPEFISEMAYWIGKSNTEKHTDMAVFNYLAYKREVIHGYPVNTRFKEFETNNAWFRHK